MQKLDKFTTGYIVCSLWSSTDESRDDGGDPMDDNYGPDDIAPESLDTMIKDCAKFKADNQKDLDNSENSESRQGHDFWLTRNGHGAGFWDGDYPDGIEDRLTAAAESFGESSLYVGDDGLIYEFSG